MPDRTLKELEEIEKEIKLIKEIVDKHEGRKIWHNPFDRNTRRDDTIKLNKPLINDLEKLISSENIQSCECLKLIDIFNRALKTFQKSIIPVSSTSITYTEKLKPVGNLSLDEIYNELRLNPLGRKINQELDKIKGSGCTPIACSQQILEEAKTLAFDPENITISENQSYDPKSRILIL